MRSTTKYFSKITGSIIVMSAFCLAGCAPATYSKTVARPLSMGAWITYWDFERGSAALEQTPHLYEDVFFFSWAMNSKGNPILINKDVNEMQRTLSLLKRARIRTWLTVVNDVHYSNGRFARKDSETVNQLLIDEERRSSHRHKLIQQARLYGFDGIDIDYENLRPELRQPFSQFIRELASDLKQENLKLSITVQPKRGESRSIGPGAMDWSVLCQYVDRFQIMLYNLHNKHTKPGPMASTEWIREVLEYAQKNCSREKIVPVLKVSGMRWGPTETTGIQYVNANKLMQQHDGDLQRQALSVGGAPYFTYRDKHGEHTVFYEDASSLLEKIRQLRSLGFGKIVLWSLGQHDARLHYRLLEIGENKIGRKNTVSLEH